MRSLKKVAGLKTKKINLTLKKVETLLKVNKNKYI